MNLQKTWKNNSVTDRLVTVFFITYLIVLHWILLFKLSVQFSYMDDRSVNLIPLYALIRHVVGGLIEIVSNVVIFIADGIYAGILFDRWHLGRKCLIFFASSLISKVLQFSFPVGSFDIKDIITNITGGIIGLM